MPLISPLMCSPSAYTQHCTVKTTPNSMITVSLVANLHIKRQDWYYTEVNYYHTYKQNNHGVLNQILTNKARQSNTCFPGVSFTASSCSITESMSILMTEPLLCNGVSCVELVCSVIVSVFSAGKFSAASNYGSITKYIGWINTDVHCLAS